MNAYSVIRLAPENYRRCSNIWNMSKHTELTQKWYDELVTGNRVIFVYTIDDAYIAEGSLVLII